jgi:hypothetical protein
MRQSKVTERYPINVRTPVQVRCAVREIPGHHDDNTTTTATIRDDGVSTKRYHMPTITIANTADAKQNVQFAFNLETEPYSHRWRTLSHVSLEEMDHFLRKAHALHSTYVL